MKKVGLWLAIAALLVNGPRFILIFLRVDNIELPLQTEAIMLAATGLATGLTLTGGGTYIAHTLAQSKAGGIIQIFMVVCWILLLVFSVILLAPLLVASIRVSPLQSVFASNVSQWAWSITAIAAVEVIAAGAMAAYAMEGRSREQAVGNKPGAVAVLTGALVRRIETQIAPTPPQSPSLPNDANSATNQAPREGKIVSRSGRTSNQSRNGVETDSGPFNGDPFVNWNGMRLAKPERQRQLLALLQPLDNEADIHVEELADRLGVSRQSIYRDLRELKERKLLKVDDDGSLDVVAFGG